MFKFLGTYQVTPRLPEKLEKLRELAYNLNWSWNQDTKYLFRRIDRDLWQETNHNPIMMLAKVSQERLEEVANDDGFLAHLQRAHQNLTSYLTFQSWFEKNYSEKNGFTIAYFSAEFGLTECLQTYSGGLGVLAGDHLKSASDLGIPLIGIGLLYKEGYFQQYLTSDGWQQERYERNDFENLPIQLVKNSDNQTLVLSVSFPGREVFFQVWKIQVGRIPLYLMDTNVQNNSPQDKRITETLYGGNSETRIQQEIILGIGGIRLVQALGFKPPICHMNEGHSAFLSLERMRLLMQLNELTFSEAKEVGYYTNIFTTHTPVPAGIDVFSNELVEKYFGNYYRNELKISDKEFYALGNINRDKDASVFNMAHLAMNTAGLINGVSKLHKVVSKKMWTSGFKSVPFNEIPIDSVTNGVHTKSHLSLEMEELFTRYLGEKWIYNPESSEVWERVDKIPDEELWRTHEKRRERLVAFARKGLMFQIKQRGGGLSELRTAQEILDPSILTIGFARRFATYKRATLLFHDLDRLHDILFHPKFPVQIIIAGKAHPKDEEGKRLIQTIHQFAEQERFRKRIVFLENYDMNVARYLVAGCDVWLNNPRRPLEASGTSGMKVIANGGLNLSIMDGWWDEAYDPEVGWKIGNREEYSNLDFQDEIESGQIYSLIEKEIVPQFYERTSENLPRRWIKMMKNSMKKLGPVYNTNRMVMEYCEKFYLQAHNRRKILSAKNWEKAKEISEWKKNVIANWDQIKVSNVTTDKTDSVFVGDNFFINADVYLGKLSVDDVEVQIYFGPSDRFDNPEAYAAVPMKLKSKSNSEDGMLKFSGAIPCLTSGMQGFTIRILPKHKLMVHHFELGRIYWTQK
ncbi:MAG: alpha-glucan phosphorylase [Chlorobiaceae bacterium]|nr:alpha-glucan phosphorylase [Chlorobiaceae bacterium]